MLKTLVIIRHGKATRDYLSISDFDRPLKESGIINTHTVALKLKVMGITPDCIVSSPAIRALHTAVIVAKDHKFPMERIILNQVIYGESMQDILDVVKSTSDACNNLFIFGHNPVFTDLPNQFLKNTIDNLATSGAAILKFDIPTWNAISKNMLKEEIIIDPK
jgi:phosphohistidine phosphatase